MDEIVRTLFPDQKQEGAKTGRDTAGVLKAVARSHPELWLSMYNSCLQTGIFYSSRKEVRPVLISKGKGPTGAATSYIIPLCMLDSPGKLLGKTIRPQLHAALQAAGDLSKKQHGESPP